MTSPVLTAVEKLLQEGNTYKFICKCIFLLLKEGLEPYCTTLEEVGLKFKHNNRGRALVSLSVTTNTHRLYPMPQKCPNPHFHSRFGLEVGKVFEMF